jgi:hypothetical protein
MSGKSSGRPNSGVLDGLISPIKSNYSGSTHFHDNSGSSIDDLRKK